MNTLTEYWQDVEHHTESAILIAWDECHKIYLAMDEQEAQWFRESGYTTVTGTPREMFAKLQEWYDNSCWLKFIQAVEHNPENPNDGYTSLIPQGAGEQDDEEDSDW